MFRKNVQPGAAETAAQRAAAAGHPAGSARRSVKPAPAAAARSCCCLAKPQVKVIMPATPTRPHPVDLWLCGHHYRASQAALAEAGAAVQTVGHDGADWLTTAALPAQAAD
jgi:hypothetical protein